ncbi:hypothetical protein, partial [Ralstonia pseudosolanacearum]|uniref:hypothetical protein n=1 Tax=Ralstonia pseudosolanacearum TaxID=1310165 RepID=UPI001FF97A36
QEHSAVVQPVWSGESGAGEKAVVGAAGEQEIYRVYFNYCEAGEDKKTPAMRLGLARGRVDSEDILYFTTPPPERQRVVHSSINATATPLTSA